MPKTKYTREVLAPLVASSTSYSDVIRKLGLPTTGGNHRLITARIRRWELDTSHFGGRSRRRIELIADDELRDEVQSVRSFAAILKNHGLATEGRPQHELKRRIAALQLDTSHFTGPAWNRGETTATNESLARAGRKRRLSDADVFSANSGYVNSGTSIIKRLLERGWLYACAMCGISEWQGKPLSLHLDHINGIHNDNRLINLRMLCPNCHSQTDTYCRKRSASTSRASEPRGRYSCYTDGTRAWRNWYPRQP